MPAEQADPHGLFEPAIFAGLKSGVPPQDSYYPGCALTFDCYCTVCGGMLVSDCIYFTLAVQLKLSRKLNRKNTQAVKYYYPH
jgi:hypothetical protein